MLRTKARSSSVRGRSPLVSVTIVLQAVLVWELAVRWLLDWFFSPIDLHPVFLESWNAPLSIASLNVAFAVVLYLCRQEILRTRSRTEFLLIVLLHTFSVFVLAQALMRPNFAMEAVRCVSLVLMLQSASAAAGAISRASREELGDLLGRLRVAILVAIGAGILLSIARGGYIVWSFDVLGSGVRRAWYPFFIFSLAGTLPVLVSWKATRARLGVLAGIGLMVLLTQTRTLLFILAFFAVAYTIRSVLGSRRFVLGGVALAMLTGGANWVLSRSSRLTRLDASDGVNGFNGRLELNQIFLEVWARQGTLGIGQQAVEDLISLSGARATTEHGFIVWFAAFGAPAALFLAMVLLGLFEASKSMVVQALSVEQVALGIGASCYALLGIWSALGSAGAASDWFGLLMLFASARGLLRSRRQAPMEVDVYRVERQTPGLVSIKS